MAKFTWFKASVPEQLPAKQVYGIAFSSDNRVILRIEDGKYKLTGGRPEDAETFEETLKREYLEELNIELEDIHYLGYTGVKNDGIVTASGSENKSKSKLEETREMARIR